MTDVSTYTLPGKIAESPLTSAVAAIRQLTDRLHGPRRPSTVARNAVDAALSEAANDVLGETIERLSAEVSEAERIIAEQQQRIAELERLATTDPLTGIANRRGFEAAIHRVLSRAKRDGTGGVMIYVDLDDFKSVNDTHGHEAGDAVLQEVARILGASARDFDVVSRLGGDEFAVILVGADLVTGRRRAEELYHCLNGGGIAWQNGRIALRASFGIEVFDGNSHPAEILSRADAAMYRSKQGAAADTPAADAGNRIGEAA